MVRELLQNSTNADRPRERIRSISRRPTRLTWLLLVVVFWLLSGVASAAAPIREELPADARVDWDAARELYDARDYRSALVHFEKTYELSKNPRVLFNVGVCYKDLTQYAQAIRSWERALGFRERLDAKDISQIELAIAAARPFVSSLRVESNQPGARLSIDGTEIGTTPFLELVPIDVGRRRVVLTKEGFANNEAMVDVVQGTPVSLVLNLTPLLKTGTVSIAVTPAQAVTLFMDGRELGRAPFRGEVPAGPHTFEARAPGFETARQTSEVGFGQVLQLSFTLAASRNEGKLRVVANHADSVIYLDGEAKGRGSWEGIVAVGGHQLRVEKPGYQDYTDELSLSRDQTRTVEVRLTKAQSWIWWTVGVVAVVGGGTAAALLLSKPTETSPVSGTLDTVSPRF